MAAPPRVSIITATYNRSRALSCAIRSVRAQTDSNWEHVIVGDACTDDTAAIVAGFDDRRIRFENLPTNAGEQSVPNNYGVAQARGRYLAFLNHDDLWLPDHLARLLGSLEASSADIVFPYIALVLPKEGPILADVSRSGRYEPHVAIPASAWVLRAAVAERVGPWKSFRDCHQVPSQNWLYRAWQAGCRIELVPTVTIMIFPSGLRKGSYVGNQAEEQQLYMDRIEMSASFREDLLTEIAVTQALEGANALSTTAVGPYLVRAMRNAFRRAASFVGLPPAAAKMALRLRRPGWIIHDLRKTRGLHAIDSKGSDR
jgi:glycosyltransferase involved in cell wall biosynthesis